MLSRDELLIVGAGPSGLATAAAYRGRARILEQAEEVGGLCRSIEFGGGVFDIGGHSFHSPHAEVTALVDGLFAQGLAWQARDARVWFQGELIAYPFQDHFHQLSDAAVVAECRAQSPDPTVQVRADTLHDWILRRFGAGVAERFLLPYNRKLWGRDLHRVSCEWVGERIAGSEARGQAGPARRPLQARTLVGYPREGGFGEIFRALAARCAPIAFGRRLSRIDPVARVAHTEDGEAWGWDRFVSTMPAPALLEAIEGCPARLIELAAGLEFVSLKVLLVLAAGQVGELPQRVYVADPEIPPHKVAFNHTSSDSLRRRPVHAISCEIACAEDRRLTPETALERATLDWLVGAGFVRRASDVIETRWLDVRHGYPVYTARRAAICAEIADYLEPLGIHAVGRFGRWQYVNSDACIYEGGQLGRRLGELAVVA